MLEFYKIMFLTKQTYDRIRLVGSQCPRMQGLLKAHKMNVLLWPILSISAHHELAKWLFEVLDPVLQYYSEYSILDFQFASDIRKLHMNLIFVVCS